MKKKAYDRILFLRLPGNQPGASEARHTLKSLPKRQKGAWQFTN
jgi:hypothetical protein